MTNKPIFLDFRKKSYSKVFFYQPLKRLFRIRRCRELRLLEVLEDVCEGILSYNVHKERTDSTRFAKGRSQTFQTLHNLV